MKKNYEPGFLESFYKCETLEDYDNKKFTNEELKILSYEGKVKFTGKKILWTVIAAVFLVLMVSEALGF